VNIHKTIKDADSLLIDHMFDRYGYCIECFGPHGNHKDGCRIDRVSDELQELLTVLSDELEMCAKIVESDPSYDWHSFACEAAAKIRARRFL